MDADAMRDMKSLGRLWSFFVAEVIAGIVLSLAMWWTFCWSTWFVGLPLIGTLVFGIRVTCPGTACMVMCPDAPVELVELTNFFNKSLGAHALYFGLMAVGALVSTVMSKDIRSQCTDKVCNVNGHAMSESDCNTECGCSESGVIVVGMFAIAVAVASVLTTLFLRSTSSRMGSVRRMSKFDRLPESDTEDDDDDDEIDPEEEARQRAALKRAQPRAVKKMFAGLASALDTGAADSLQPPGSTLDAVAAGESQPAEAAAAALSPEIADFADFEVGAGTAMQI